MDWKEFIVEVLKAMVWPIIVVGAAFFLRDKIGDLLPRLERFRHKDTEIEFSKVFEEIDRNVDSFESQGLKIYKPLLEEKTRILEISKIAPKVAVHHAWNVMDRFRMKLLVENTPDNAKKPLIVRKSKSILKSAGLNEDTMRSIDSLRRARKLSMRNADYKYSADEIESYIDLAIEVASSIEKLIANKSLNLSGAQNAPPS